MYKFSKIRSSSSTSSSLLLFLFLFRIDLKKLELTDKINLCASICLDPTLRVTCIMLMAEKLLVIIINIEKRSLLKTHIRAKVKINKFQIYQGWVWILCCNRQRPQSCFLRLHSTLTDIHAYGLVFTCHMIIRK